MATVDQSLAWYRSQLGVVEGGGRDGRSGNIVVYWDQIHHHQLQGCAWCAAFVEAGQLAVGVPVIVDSQYCPTVEAAYRRAGRLYPVERAQPGDQMFFHFAGEPLEANHTGVLESIDPGARTVTSIEGNTSSSAAGSQSNGGGVYRRSRPWSVVRSAGRPQYDLTPAPGGTAPTRAVGVVASRPVTIGGKPHMAVIVNVEIDQQGNGYQPTDLAFDSSQLSNVAVASPRPKSEGGNERYRIATVGKLNHDGKLDVVVMGADPSPPPPNAPWVVPIPVTVET